MLPFIRRFLLGVFCLLAFFTWARAQDNREYLEKPKTPAEFWRRMEFEIEVGKFDFAAQFLQGFIKTLNELPKDEADKLLLQIEDKQGMSAFLRLNRIASLLEDAKARKTLGGEVAKLVKRVSEAVHAELKSRMPRAFKNLTRSSEERAWGIAQLDRLRQEAVPDLVQSLQKTEGQRGHEQILSAMVKLNDILPPLLAALDIKDNELRKDILYLIGVRRETRAVPELYYLTASPRLPAEIRARTRETLAGLLEIDPDRVAGAKQELTRLAERYYHHQVRLKPADAVHVWKYDPPKNELVRQTMTAAQAEDFYGLRYGKQALDIDSTYRPAQRVVLSLLLDRAFGAEIQEPLAKRAPQLKELMATLDPALVVDTLDQAFSDHRLGVILGAIQALGDLGDVAAARRAVRGAPVLAKALDYPNRRVQMAAVEAMLRIPGSVPPLSSTRIVEILRRILLAEPKPHVLVAYSNLQRVQEVAKSVQAAGYEPVPVRDRREAMTRLKGAADVDAILLDATFPSWAKEFPYTLSAFRADMDIGLIPVIVTAPTDQELRLRHYVAGYRNVWVEPEQLTQDAVRLKAMLRKVIQEGMGRPLSQTERKAYADAALDWLARMARGELTGFDVRPAEDAVMKALHSTQPEMVAGAIEVLGRIPGRDARMALANVLLDPQRDKLRSLAAVQLGRHIQQNGRLLGKEQAKQIKELFASTKDDKLKAAVALVIGSMRPGPALTGRRLKDFQPQPPPAPEKKAPPEPAKDK